MSSNLQNRLWNRLTSSNEQIRFQADLDTQARELCLLREALERSQSDLAATNRQLNFLKERVEALEGPSCHCGGFDPECICATRSVDGINPSAPIYIEESQNGSDTHADMAKSDNETRSEAPCPTDTDSVSTDTRDRRAQEDEWLYRDDTTDEEMVCANRHTAAWWSCRCFACK